jgi:xylan 1,4-beta-xylosidase
MLVVEFARRAARRAVRGGAVAVKTVLEAQGRVDAYSWWTFSDIFEENYFPSVPFHGGFGLLNLHGIAKPVYRAFELLHGVGDRMLARTGEHDTVDAWAIRGERALTVIVTNFALPRHPVNDETVEIVLRHCAAGGRASLRRIDSRHANAKAAWQRLREPEYPTAAQLTRLARASLPRAERIVVERARGVTTLRVRVPPRGVAAIDLARRNVR